MMKSNDTIAKRKPMEQSKRIPTGFDNHEVAAACSCGRKSADRVLRLRTKPRSGDSNRPSLSPLCGSTDWWTVLFCGLTSTAICCRHSVAGCVGSLGGRIAFVAMILWSIVLTSQSVAQEAVFDKREQRLVGGLRDRSLFELAESHCLKVLACDGLTQTDFASIATERIRLRTSQARTAEDRSIYWQMVDKIADDFNVTNPENPKSVLVGLQQALAHISFATLLKQEVEARIAKPDGRKQGLQQLTSARTNLDRTKQQAIDTIKAQANQNLSPDMLSGEQLRTLITSIEYQLAIVNLTSAQLTDANSETEKLNRLDSLGRVPDQLKAVREAVSQSKPLWWKTWIAEATCRRMLGELPAAGQILKSIKNDRRPKSTDRMLLQEEIAFVIATGDRNQMKSFGDRAIKKRHDAETEVALIQLLVTSGQIGKASALANKVSAMHGLWWARRADIALLSGSGASDAKSTASVDSAGNRMLLEAAENAETNGDFDAAARGYLSVADSQFSSGDRRAGLTTTVRAAMAMEKQRKHGEAAAALLKSAKAHASEELAPSIHLRGCWNLSKAKSDQFETEALAHIGQWPKSESSNQARYWVASQQLSRKDYKVAFETLVQTQTSSPQFPAAVKLARFASRKQLSALEEKGLAPRALARRLQQRWADSWSNCSDQSRPLVASAMAELCLGWDAEDTRKSAERMKAAASLPSAKSNAEFHYLLAMHGRQGKDQSIAQANALPFDGKMVGQLFLLLGRMDQSKQVSEIKLAIADNAIAKATEPKSKNLFLLARASALSELGREVEAEAIFKQLMAAGSKDLNVMLGMARVSGGENALKLWRSIASRTKQQTPAWFEAKYNVARLLHESGKSRETAKMLKYIKAVPPGWKNSELKDKFERLLKESSR